MKIELKRAEKADTSIMQKISDDSFRADFEKFGECPGFGRTAESFVESIEKSLLYLILADGRAVGLVSGYPNDNSCYIGVLCVIPEYQHMGICSKALDMFEKNHPFAEYTLTTPAQNPHCVSFYTKHGFVEVGRHVDGKVELIEYSKKAELFDVLDDFGNYTGKQAARAEIHRTGAWHGSVHVWVIRGEKMLLQRRSMSKDTFAGCIDGSCTGHVDAGEEYTDAAVREVGEELGLTITAKDLHCFMKQEIVNKTDEFFNREFNVVYLLDESVSLDNMHYQESEIDELFWIDLESLRAAVELGNEKYCIIPNEFRAIYSYIRKGR